MEVIKRNGDIVPYDLEKISIAISGAFQDLNEEFEDLDVLDYIDEEIKFTYRDQVHIEDVQDLVEDALIRFGYIPEAKAYIRYRYKHELERRAKIDKSIEDKLLAKQIDNQNANIDEHSFGGRMGEANSVMMKQYALDHCMCKKSRDNHLNNEIYIHDLDHYAVGDHNCLTIPFDDLLAKGFNTRQTDVRPANSINTACQLVAVIFQLQSLMQFGGVSASHIDWTMVPYVRKSFRKHFIDGLKYCVEDFPFEIQEYMYHIPEDASIENEEYKLQPKAYEYALDMTLKETHQAVEGMYHNLNTLQSRSGN